MPTASRPVLIISGTNRPGSNALRVANVIRSHYQRVGVEAGFFSLEQMPRELFDPACYAKKPPAWEEIQRLVVESAGLHIVVPEYNGSFPGVLKYFIDMLKLPESFEHKPVAFVGEAAGIWGNLRGVEQLQHVFGYRNAYVYPDRVFIPGVGQKLDADGKFIDASIEDRISKQVAGFVDFVRRLTTA